MPAGHGSVSSMGGFEGAMGMAKQNGFKNPVTRPRYIVWTFVWVFALAAFIVVALGASSTYWFCADVCHKVQDDTIKAYQASDHNKISCMICHEPVGADPVTFLLAKAKAGLEVIPTVGNTFSLPLNEGSALALNPDEMGSKQCLQCHSTPPNTTVNGIIINHTIHAEAGISCTMCHNRVAHNDTAAPPQLEAPNGTKNVAHPNFMQMDYCFRCHDLQGKVKMTGIGAKAAPGTCSTCHVAGSDLIPASHKAADWSVMAHGPAARAATLELGKAQAEAEKIVQEDGTTAYLTAPVYSCDECHVQSQFCDPCHARLKVTVTK